MRNFAKYFFSDSLLKQGSLIFFSSVVVNIFNLIYWLVMVRKLSPSDYGALNSLVSLMMLFSIPASIVQTVVTRYVSKFIASENRAEARDLLIHFGRIIFIFVTLVVFILILGRYQVAQFLKIEEIYLIYFVAAGIIFSSLTACSMGALCGFQKFNSMAINNIFSGIAKLGFGFFLVAIGWKIAGAMLGFVLSFFVILVISIIHMPNWLLRLKHAYDPARLDLKNVYAYFFPVSLCVLCFFLLTNADVILVKHYFVPIDAGHYSIAQTVGRIALFIPGAIGAVMFPKIIDAHVKNKETRSILYRCLIVVGFLCGTVVLASLLFPQVILKVLTGHTQPQSVVLVKYFTTSMSFLALVNILMLYHLSLHQMRYIYVLIFGALALIAGISIFHSSLIQVLLVLLACSSLLFFIGIILTKRTLRL